MPDIDTGNIVVGAFPDEGGVAYTSFAANPVLPEDAESPLGSDMDSLGDLSTDGFTEMTDLSSNDFEDCRGAVVLTVENTKKRKVKLKFIEATRASVLKFIYGEDAVDVSGGLLKGFDIDSKPVKERPLVIEQLWTNGWKARYVLDRFKITNYSDVPHNKQNLLGFEVEGTLLENNGRLGHVYFAAPSDQDPAFPEGEPSESWTKDQLLAWCEENDVTATASMTKTEILAAITEAGGE